MLRQEKLTLTEQKKAISLLKTDGLEVVLFIAYYSKAQDANPLNPRINLAPGSGSSLPDEEKSVVLKFITAYIRDFNTQKAYAS